MPVKLVMPLVMLLLELRKLRIKVQLVMLMGLVIMSVQLVFLEMVLFVLLK